MDGNPGCCLPSASEENANEDRGSPDQRNENFVLIEPNGLDGRGTTEARFVDYVASS